MDKQWFENLSKKKRTIICKKIKESDRNKFRNIIINNKIYNKLRRAAKKLYFKNQFDKFTKNSKQTWSVIREVIGTSKHKDQIPTFFQKNGQVISDCLEIVNGFNGFFAGIGPKLAAEIGPSDVSFDSYLNINQDLN